MLDKFRRFKDSKYAMVLVAMIAIPFVLWGMGGTFQSGKTNSIGKINNYNISTKEFIEHITLSRLDENNQAQSCFVHHHQPTSFVRN